MAAHIKEVVANLVAALDPKKAPQVRARAFTLVGALYEELERLSPDNFPEEVRAEFVMCRADLRPWVTAISMSNTVNLVALAQQASRLVDLYRSPLASATPGSPQLPVPVAAEDGSPTRDPNERVDIAIVCALHRPELEQVLQTAQTWAEVPSVREDPTTYHRSTYTTPKGTSLSVIAASPTRMGMVSSAVLATKMIFRFQPRLVAMVGIAAGAKTDKQGFGDILAPERTFDYNSGKVTRREDKLTFEPDPDPVSVSPRLIDRLKHWSRAGAGLRSVAAAWTGLKPPTPLAMHVGTLGSGAAVIDALEPLEDVLANWRKLIGIEMEAYGVHVACRDAVSPQVEFLCFKSICDFTEGKTDTWHDYAAFTAAQACHRFLVTEWENLHL